MADLIRVLVFGAADAARVAKIQSADLGPAAARAFDIQAHASDRELRRLLVSFRPHVIVSLGGAAADYPELLGSPLEVRKRWVHFDDPATDPAAIADAVMRTFVRNATTDPHPDQPLVSVFTPTYKTGELIRRPHESLRAQTYDNWEWVVYDDSPDDGATFRMVSGLAEKDARITAYRAHVPLGVIGEVKRRACGLCRGRILVELDHDDELTEHALALVVAAFARFPGVGFAYTDCAEVSDLGEPLSYGETFAFGFGSYRTELYKGKPYAVTNYPGVNAKTIRHIVGVPNHVRAWRRDAYWAAGGHSPEVHVADDYELLVRTFLMTRMVHIPALGYIQYHSTSGTANTQRTRNKEIQRLVPYFQHRYEARIHERLLELGVDDFIWRNGVLDWNAPNPGTSQDVNHVAKLG